MNKVKSIIRPLVILAFLVLFISLLYEAIDTVFEYPKGHLGWFVTYEQPDPKTVVISGWGKTGNFNRDQFDGRISPVANLQWRGDVRAVIEDGVTAIGDYALCNANYTENDPTPSFTSISIPDSVTYIGQGAFAYCVSLTDIVIPDSVKKMDSVVFEFCTSLEHIKLSNKLSVIPFAAFECCYSLNSVELPQNLETIEEYGFSCCEALESITFPESLAVIEPNAFVYTGLKEITFLGSAPKMDYDCFRYCIATVYYPADDPSWTPEVMKNYGGKLTWVAY